MYKRESVTVTVTILFLYSSHTVVEKFCTVCIGWHLRIYMYITVTIHSYLESHFRLPRTVLCSSVKVSDHSYESSHRSSSHYRFLLPLFQRRA